MRNPSFVVRYVLDKVIQSTVRTVCIKEDLLCISLFSLIYMLLQWWMLSFKYWGWCIFNLYFTRKIQLRYKNSFTRESWPRLGAIYEQVTSVSQKLRLQTALNTQFQSLFFFCSWLCVRSVSINIVLSYDNSHEHRSTSHLVNKLCLTGAAIKNKVPLKGGKWS